jgi:hypothetical protein
MYARVTIPDWLRTGKTVAGLYQRWIFRGQTSATWNLQTTLERAAIQKNLAFARDSQHASQLTTQAFSELPIREDWIITQFQRRAHLVMNTPPPLDARLDWLAAIQHYGGPTRLLDFTHSFYVATFFAVEQATEDAAVWALWAPDIETGNQLAHDRLDRVNQQAITLAERVLRGETSKPGVLHVEPFQLNERMSVQKGVFVLPLDVTKPFMDNLAQTFPFDFAEHESPKNHMPIADLLAKGLSGGPHVIKFVFPRIDHNLILQDLAAMNIDAGTLFPGLPGYARSMHRHV